MMSIILYLVFTTYYSEYNCSCELVRLEDRSEIVQAKKELMNLGYYNIQSTSKPLDGDRLILWYAKFSWAKNYSYKLIDERYDELLKQEIKNLSCLMHKNKDLNITIEAFDNRESSRLLNLQLTGQCSYIKDALMTEGISLERIRYKVIKKKVKMISENDFFSKILIHRRIEVSFNYIE